MDEPPTIGFREVKRDFEEDRHSRDLLATAFERLAVASDNSSHDFDSVQAIQQTTREQSLYQEVN
jgi:hypothetical protein